MRLRESGLGVTLEWKREYAIRCLSPGCYGRCMKAPVSSAEECMGL